MSVDSLSFTCTIREFHLAELGEKQTNNSCMKHGAHSMEIVSNSVVWHSGAKLEKIVGCVHNPNSPTDLLHSSPICRQIGFPWVY